MKKSILFIFLIWHLPAVLLAQGPVVKISTGQLEGLTEASGIKSFKGIPFAEAPIGALRWKAPQSPEAWTGVKKAIAFGPNAMQKKPYGDMGFRSAGMSEDCLYLNVWTPAKTFKEKLPVLVYFYGGGFIAGDGSEPRYDGEQMSKKGIVVLTVNYRLGIFGFFSHPELTAESEHKASGNYGLLDQHAALEWVQKNIAAFGGDPKHVTIAGESAGSISVSAQMASPLSKTLFHAAIGESGAMINPTLAPIPLKQGEQNGLSFAQKTGAQSIAELRARPAAQLLDESTQARAFSAAATIDGYFLTKSIPETFKAAEQAQVPLLAGWNSAEVPYQVIMGAAQPTVENYAAKIKQLYPDDYETVMQLYPGRSAEEVVTSATALSSDRFIVYSTWKWLELQRQNSKQAVYRYLFSKSKPPMTAKFAGVTPGLAGGINKAGEGSNTPKPIVSEGAPHAFEIEYAMGNLATNPVYAWSADDYKVSAQMLDYFANFVKKYDPNGPALPRWTPLNGSEKESFMTIGLNTMGAQDDTKPRYIFLDKKFNN